jgi:Ca2+-binding RTX toxin-like protein
MAIEIPSSNTQYEITASNETYVLKASSALTITGMDSAINQSSGFSDVTLLIKGDIDQSASSAFAAIVMTGQSSTLHVFATSFIKATTGAEMTAANASVINDGVISSSAQFGYGLYSEGADTQITNNHNIVALGASGTGVMLHGEDGGIYSDGLIKGATGINFDDLGATIDLDTHSRVVGTVTAAIFSESTEASDKSVITNRGDITGTGGAYAIELGDPADKITNRGDIVGRIYLGSGNDTFDNRGGTVDHAIQGGSGNDTLFTDKAGVKLQENGGSEGYDTVRSSVSYTLSANVERLVLTGNGDTKGTGTSDGDDLFGNAGNNKLFGLQGVDVLSGGKGNDQLTGGGGHDTFVFKTGFGHDKITDFQNGIDRIDVSLWNGMDDIGDIKHHTTASHGDLILTLGSDQLVIENMTKAQLNGSDFEFQILV